MPHDVSKTEDISPGDKGARRRRSRMQTRMDGLGSGSGVDKKRDEAAGGYRPFHRNEKQSFRCACKKV
jgi:hypothetical protein